MVLPPLTKISQEFPRLGLPDVARSAIDTLADSNLRLNIRPGMRVGITAGSRGIRNIDIILREVALYVKFLGGLPLLLAAMGSHGGAEPAGQKKLLHSLGITEAAVGAPLVCSAECVAIGRAFFGEVYLNRSALDCDAIIVVNRVKPHTSFHGDHESGLLKMLAVGLGGPAGAASLHRCQPGLLSRAVAEAGQVVLQAAPVVLGLAILEDAYDDTRRLVAVEPSKFFGDEKKLLEEARGYLPGLPTSEVDILVVDEIGKNFSGTGMDTNVIGRLRIQGSEEPASPRVKRIVALDVAPAAHGNAYGIGLADFTTRRLVDKMDRKAVYLNALTSTFVQRAMIPMTLPSHREALEAAIKSLGEVSPAKCRVIRIHNTLHLAEMLVSGPVLQEVSALPHIKVIGPEEEIHFSGDGSLLPF